MATTATIQSSSAPSERLGTAPAPLPRSSGFCRWALCVALIGLCSLALTSPAEAQDAAKDAAAIETYFETLATFRPKALEVSGMTVTASVIPDLRTYSVAKELRTALRNGWDQTKIDAHLKKQERKLNKLAKRFRVRISIEPDSAKDHVFLQQKLKKHLDTEGDGKIKEVTDGKPTPRYAKWQIIQGPSMKKFTLAKFQRLTFDVTIEQKSSELCTLSIEKLMHYYDAPKKSVYEAIGINVGARQISLGNIADMAVDPIQIELAPATWKAPKVPEAVKKALAKLDVKS